MSAETLFETSIVNNRIAIDRVYANEFHSLRCIEVKSLCDSPLTIKLRSNLGAQIAFQESNENLPRSFIEANRPSIFSVASNTVESAQSNAGYSNGILGRQFDPLLNMIDFVDEICLEAFESKIVILVFRPDPKAKRKGVKDEKDIDPSQKKHDDDDVFEMAEINGMVFLFAYKMLAEDKAILPPVEQTDQSPPDQQVSL
jgi:hypothetical protein